MNTYKVMKSARFRSQPTMTTNDTGASSVVGDTFQSDTIRPDTNNSAVTMVLHTNGKWLPLKIDAIVYTELIPATIPNPNDIVEILNIVTTYKTADGVTHSVTSVPI